MKLSAISKIYWRKIKDGERTYQGVVGESKKTEVKELARQEVVAGSLTQEEYREIIGQEYPTGSLETESV